MLLDCVCPTSLIAQFLSSTHLKFGEGDLFDFLRGSVGAAVTKMPAEDDEPRRLPLQLEDRIAFGNHSQDVVLADDGECSLRVHQDDAFVAD